MIQNQEIKNILWKRFFTSEKRAKSFCNKISELIESCNNQTYNEEEVERLRNEIQILYQRMNFTILAMKASASLLGCSNVSYFSQN